MRARRPLTSYSLPAEVRAWRCLSGKLQPAESGVSSISGTHETERHQRTVMATDTEWRRIRERAEAAGMPISRFICQRAAGPERRPLPGVAPEAMLARQERIETVVLVLAEIERQRLAERGEEEGWEAAARRVALRPRAERPVAGDAPS